jgi:hypothetical protein
MVEALTGVLTLQFAVLNFAVLNGFVGRLR